jgi:hypothetical protein
MKHYASFFVFPEHSIIDKVLHLIPSHKFNPLSVPQGYVEICNLGNVGGGKVCRGHSLEGYYDTCWLAGLWSTQAKVDSIVLQVAWHCGSNSSVVNDSLGEPGQTPFYVGLHPCRAPWLATVCCSRLVGELLNWEFLRDANEQLPLETEQLSP